MIKKIIIVVLAIIVLAGSAWFIYKDLNKNNNVIVPNGEQTTGGISYETASSTQATSDKQDLEFKKLALEIAAQRILFKTGISEAKKEEIQKQVQDIYSKIESDYKGLNLWIDLGLLKQSVGDYDGAKEAFEFANKISPKNYVSFQNLGFLYGFYLKNPIESEKNYLKSLENDPSNTQVYLDLADIYFYDYKEKTAEIPDFLLKGIKNVNESEQTLLKARLGKYYAEIKDYPSAIKYYEEVLVGDPSNQGLKDEIGRLKAL